MLGNGLRHRWGQRAVSTPESRVSLILRLPNADDAEAWNEFVGELYEGPTFLNAYAFPDDASHQ